MTHFNLRGKSALAEQSLKEEKLRDIELFAEMIHYTDFALFCSVSVVHVHFF